MVWGFSIKHSQPTYLGEWWQRFVLNSICRELGQRSSLQFTYLNASWTFDLKDFEVPIFFDWNILITFSCTWRPQRIWRFVDFCSYFLVGNNPSKTGTSSRFAQRFAMSVVRCMLRRKTMRMSLLRHPKIGEESEIFSGKTTHFSDIFSQTTSEIWRFNGLKLTTPHRPFP